MSIVKNIKSGYFLVLFLFAAFLLRITNINERGLAGDEKYSLFVSQFIVYDGNNQMNSVRKPNNETFTPKEFWSEKGTKDFLESIARLDNGNGALYLLILRGWINMVGLADGWIRLLPVIFNLATIPMLFHFVRVHFRNRSVALLAAFLATISPFFIVYSQINRTYTLLFFLALLSTHLFLLTIDKLKNGEKASRWLILYGLSVSGCLFCHVAIFPLFFIHGLHLIIFHRNIRLIVLFAAAMLIPITTMSSWLVLDGGKYMYKFVKNSTDTYNKMAEIAPNDFLSKSTPKTIALQMRHVVSLMYITAEGLFRKTDGLVNVLLSIAASAVAVVVFNLRRQTAARKTVIVLISTTILFYFINIGRIPFLILSFNLTLPLICFSYIRTQQDPHLKAKLTFLALLSFISIISLIGFAVMDGNTFRIITRYPGYAYSFNLCLLALIIHWVYVSKPEYSAFFWTSLALQLSNIVSIISSVFNDNPPHYFAGYGEPRVKNPYITISEFIKDNYAKNDTVFYPSHGTFINDSGKIVPSVVDAQLVNIYLPKNADYIQKINYQEQNKVYLKKADGRSILIFDFQNTRYRY